jgi:hypothetical protein
MLTAVAVVFGAVAGLGGVAAIVPVGAAVASNWKEACPALPRTMLTVWVPAFRVTGAVIVNLESRAVELTKATNPSSTAPFAENRAWTCSQQGTSNGWRMWATRGGVRTYGLRIRIPILNYQILVGN